MLCLRITKGPDDKRSGSQISNRQSKMSSIYLHINILTNQTRTHIRVWPPAAPIFIHETPVPVPVPGAPHHRRSHLTSTLLQSNKRRETKREAFFTLGQSSKHRR